MEPEAVSHSGFNRADSPVVYLSEAVYYLATGKRPGRQYVQHFLQAVKRRAWTEEARGLPPTAYSRWWTKFDALARNLVEAAQAGEIKLFGDRDGARYELSQPFLTQALYGDAAKDTIRPEILPELGGNWPGDGPVYTSVALARDSLERWRPMRQAADTPPTGGTSSQAASRERAAAYLEHPGEEPMPPNQQQAPAQPRRSAGRHPDYELQRRFLTAACHILFNERSRSLSEKEFRERVLDRMAQLGWEQPSPPTAKRMMEKLWADLQRSVE